MLPRQGPRAGACPSRVTLLQGTASPAAPCTTTPCPAHLPTPQPHMLTYPQAGELSCHLTPGKSEGLCRRLCLLGLTLSTLHPAGPQVNQTPSGKASSLPAVQSDRGPWASQNKAPVCSLPRAGPFFSGYGPGAPEQPLPPSMACTLLPDATWCPAGRGLSRCGHKGLWSRSLPLCIPGASVECLPCSQDTLAHPSVRTCVHTDATGVKPSSLRGTMLCLRSR